jgi:hypothetical protein
VHLLDEGRRKAAVADQLVAAIRLSPVKAAAVEARQAQRRTENGGKQALPVGPGEQEAGELVLDLQQEIRLFALADVDDGSGAAQRAALRVALDRATARRDPQPGLVRTPQAVLDLEQRAGRGHCRIELATDLLLVLGMDRVEPGAQRAPVHAVFQPGRGDESQVVRQAVRRVVVLPDTDVGRYQDAFQRDRGLRLVVVHGVGSRRLPRPGAACGAARVSDIAAADTGSVCAITDVFPAGAGVFPVARRDAASASGPGESPD